MEITIGMKRILPTLLMSGLLCMLFATPDAAQTENSTLHPEATHGVALWGKHSRETTHTSQKKEQTSLSYKEEHSLPSDTLHFSHGYTRFIFQFSMNEYKMPNVSSMAIHR